MKNYILIFVATLMCIYVNAQNSKEYIDSRKKSVILPQAEKSFVDKFVSQKQGIKPIIGLHANAENVIGEPDYNGNTKHKESYFSLGCEGEAIFEFTDNGLINVDGPDLYIFEIGPAIEATDVYVSEDNETWIYIGKATGGTASLEIDGKVDNDKIYYFIKIIDLRIGCSGATAGADIDAIAAIGSSINENAAKNNSELQTKEEVIVSSEIVEVTIWDNSKEDGDIVEVLLNGETIIAEQSVLGEGKTFQISLNSGSNIFELKAINEGSIPPNTAAIKIEDGNKTFSTALSSEAGQSKSINIKLE